MTTGEVFLLLVVVLLASPFVVFASVKLGTYAFYCGRQNFRDEENKNGEAKRT